MPLPKLPVKFLGVAQHSVSPITRKILTPQMLWWTPRMRIPPVGILSLVHSLFSAFFAVGLPPGMERFSLVHVLQIALHYIFLYIKRMIICCMSMQQVYELLHLSWVVSWY